jgi:hypothetical protein
MRENGANANVADAPAYRILMARCRSRAPPGCRRKTIVSKDYYDAAGSVCTPAAMPRDITPRSRSRRKRKTTTASTMPRDAADADFRPTPPSRHVLFATTMQR